jgi:hypothetical protein
MLLTELFNRLPIIEQEGPPLTKGAKNVLADKRVVAGVADQLRTDHTVPVAVGRSFQKMPDEQVAEWFVRELDRLERSGVGGVIYGRDGQFHYWVANNYANGTDIWEDIEGVMPEALRDFTILKNRNLLDARHNDVQKFKGVRPLARYMLHHYEQHLEQIRKDAELSGLIKQARSIKIVDNEDYRVYMLLNRGAACAFGKGARYCTANSRTDSMWKSYSSRGAIYGLVPNKAEDKEISTDTGSKIRVKEKYQFDGPSQSFREPSDAQMNSEEIKKKFPYLWTDLVKGMKEHRDEIENPRSEDDPDTLEIKVYNVDAELKKLQSGLGSFWTNKTRPKPEENPEGNQADTAPPAPPTNT